MEFETLTLVHRTHEYDETYTYCFRPERSFAFTAGQYAHIRVPNVPEGEKAVRELSFASAPQDELLQFGIDARSGSGYQQALKALEPGDTVQLFKIRGHMTWPPPVADAVMIAGGVGVTPFRSMLRDAAQQQRVTSTTLIHVARSTHLYGDELAQLASAYYAIARARLQEVLDAATKSHPDAHYYLAGSSTFVVEVADMLAKRKIDTIERDVFTGLEE